MFLTTTMVNRLIFVGMYTPSFSEVRNWLEVSYFVSSIVIMFLLAFGLRQIQLAKKQITTTREIFRTQSKRAAVESAVVECRRFGETVIQDRVALEKYCKDNSITYFEVVEFTKTEKGFTIDAKAAKDDDINKLSKAEDLLNRLMNGLDAYALFFLSGIADEQIAFHTTGKAYVALAEHMFKLFPIMNVDDDDAQPIKTLYMMWRDRLEAKRLRVEKDNLERKLSSYKIPDIKAIGT